MTLGYATLYELPLFGGAWREVARTPWFGGRKVTFTLDRACVPGAVQVGWLPPLVVPEPRQRALPGYTVTFTLTLEEQ